MFHFREEVARRGLGGSYLVSTSDGWMGEVRRSDGMKGGRLGTLPFDVIGALADRLTWVRGCDRVAVDTVTQE